MPSGEPGYFRLRAAEERDCASAARDPKSRAVHLDLAQRYEQASGVLSDELVQRSYEALCRSLNLLSETSKHVGES